MPLPELLPHSEMTLSFTGKSSVAFVQPPAEYKIVSGWEGQNMPMAYKPILTIRNRCVKKRK